MFLFFIIRQWIIDLNYKMRMDGQRHRAWLKGIKEKWQRDRTVILKRLDKPTTEEFFATESQIAKVLFKKRSNVHAGRRCGRTEIAKRMYEKHKQDAGGQDTVE